MKRSDGPSSGTSKSCSFTWMPSAKKEALNLYKAGKRKFHLRKAPSFRRVSGVSQEILISLTEQLAHVRDDHISHDRIGLCCGIKLS